MTRVFADTSFYQALFSTRDNRHSAATKVFGQLDAVVVTTEYVLLELGALMSRGPARTLYLRFVEQMRLDVMTEIVPASTALFDLGLALFAARPDKEWSLTDCISFVVMQQQGITDALTYDRHFEQPGFRALAM